MRESPGHCKSRLLISSTRRGWPKTYCGRAFENWVIKTFSGFKEVLKIIFNSCKTFSVIVSGEVLATAGFFAPPAKQVNKALSAPQRFSKMEEDQRHPSKKLFCPAPDKNPKPLSGRGNWDRSINK